MTDTCVSLSGDELQVTGIGVFVGDKGIGLFAEADNRRRPPTNLRLS